MTPRLFICFKDVFCIDGIKKNVFFLSFGHFPKWFQNSIRGIYETIFVSCNTVK